MECEVHPAGIVVMNRYALEPSERGVRMRHSIEVSGRVAGMAKALRLDKLYTRLLRREIRRLIALAQAGPP